MSERLLPGQIETAKRVSRNIEKAWRVFTFPRRHSFEEVKEATGYLVEQKKSVGICIDLQVGDIDPEIFDQVFMGLYHHEVNLPPELKFKDPRRN